MATGENFIRNHASRSAQEKGRLIVDKKTEQKIRAQIENIAKQRDDLYSDKYFHLEDEEISAMAAPLTAEINWLIESMYETKQQINQRLGYKRYSNC